MVREIKRDGEVYFQCEECKFLYKEKEWAKRCEAYCKEHHSCSIEITAHAVQAD